ncbi:MAG: hypothetical protein U9N59_06090 [Campylobacterota bacterium]|nr:hypothetical protein [Campylobacterota bacterium]
MKNTEFIDDMILNFDGAIRDILLSFLLNSKDKDSMSVINKVVEFGVPISIKTKSLNSQLNITHIVIDTIEVNDNIVLSSNGFYSIKLNSLNDIEKISINSKYTNINVVGMIEIDKDKLIHNIKLHPNYYIMQNKYKNLTTLLDELFELILSNAKYMKAI